MIETFIEKLKKDNIKIYNFEELEIGETLGEGANGKVYRCNYMNKRYAAKKIHKNHVLNNNEFKFIYLLGADSFNFENLSTAGSTHACDTPNFTTFSTR